MKINTRHTVCLCLFFIVFLSFFSRLGAEEIKIKVISDEAAIHVKPDITSDMIENPPMGRKYEADEKIGEWYRIRFSSRLGVLITGYIHEQHVQVEKEEEPELKKEVAQKPELEKPETKLQDILSQEKIKWISFHLGGMIHFDMHVYWHEYGFPFRSETFAIKDYLQGEESVGINGGVGLFVFPNFEIIGDLAFISRKAWNELEVEVPSPFRFNDSSEADSSRQTKFNEVILLLGFNYFPVAKGTVRPSFGLGGVYASGSFDMTEDFTYLETTNDLVETHSVTIQSVKYQDKSLSAFGFFVRAGLDLRILESFGFFVLANYIYAQKAIQFTLYQNEWTDVSFGGFSIWAGIRFFL